MGIRPRADGVTRLGRIPAELRVGKTTESISQGESGTVQFWGGTDPDTLSETNEAEVTAYLRLYTSVDSDRWVYVMRFPWGFEITDIEC